MADTNNPDQPGNADQPDKPGQSDVPADTAPSPSQQPTGTSGDNTDESAAAQGESLDGGNDDTDGSAQGSGDQTDGGQGGDVQKDSNGRIDATHGSALGGSQPPKQPETPAAPSPFKRLRKTLNIYTGLFIFILLVAVIVILVAYQQNHKTSNGSKIKTQELSQSTLDQLANSDVTVGNNQSVLTVQSSAIFAGQVLIKQNLEVAGNLKIGGTISLSSLVVGGTSQFGQVNISRDLAVSGNTALQGTATITKSLQVGGGGTFNGPVSAPQITTGTLQLNGDLALAHHVTTNGAQPGRSGGSALGGGGSVSLSGSDTAGSININTGGGPGAGCFVTVNFTSHYNTTPHVIVTPIGAAAGGLSYYVNRSASSFSVCVASPPPAGASFGFDYFVID